MNNSTPPGIVNLNFGKPTVVIVMGVSGCGKSTLAKRLSEKLNYLYVEADDFHSVANKTFMSNGKPLTDAMRLPWVITLRDHLKKHTQAHRNCVLAFSGLRRKHRDLLRIDSAEVIYLYLQGSKQIIMQRISARTDHFMPVELLDSQLETLEKPTPQEGIITLDIRQSIDQLTESGLEALINYYK